MTEREQNYERYRDEGWWREERLTDDVRRWASTRGDRLAAPPTVEEITTAFGEMGVPKYKWPERIESLDELPLTTTGKVRHQVLRDRV